MRISVAVAGSCDIKKLVTHSSTLGNCNIARLGGSFLHTGKLMLLGWDARSSHTELLITGHNEIGVTALSAHAQTQPH